MADVTAGVVHEDEARQDPDLAQLYNLDPDLAAPGRPEAASPSFAGDDVPEPDLMDPGFKTAPESLFPAGETPLTAGALGAELGVSPRVVRGFAERKEITAYKIGRSWYFSRSELIKAIKARQMHAAKPVDHGDAGPQ